MDNNINYDENYILNLFKEFDFFNTKKLIDCINNDNLLVQNIIKANIKKIVSLIDGYDILTKSSFFYECKNEFLISELLELNRIDLVLGFDVTLVDKIVDNKFNEVIDIIVKKGSVPYGVKKNQKILYELMKRNKIDLVLEFDESLVDEMLDNNFKEVIDFIVKKGIVPWRIIKNKKIFNEILKLNRIDLVLEFDESLIDEIVDNKLNEIIDIIVKKEIVPYNIKENKKIFDKLFKLNKINLALEFDESLVDEMLDNNFKEVIDFIVKNGSVPWGIIKNKKIFDELLKLNRLDLVLEFDEFLVDKILDDKFNEIIDIIVKKGIVPYNIKKNKKIFNEILKLNRIDLVLEFDEYLIDEIVDNKLNEIIDIIVKKEIVPYNIKKNKKIFNELLKLNRIDLVLEFDKSLIDGIVDDKLNEIIDFIVKKIIVPYNINENKKIFDELLKLNRFDLVLQFDKSLIDGIVDDKLNEIIDFIVKEGSVPWKICTNKKIFNELLKLNRLDLVLEFDESFFTNEFLDEYFDSILSYNNGTIQIKKSILLSYCLENNKLNYISQFSGELFNEEVIDKFDIYFKINDYFNGIVPVNLLNSTALLECVIMKEDYEMAINFYNQSSFVKDPVIKDKYSKILGISTIELDNKINYLINKNDEVLDTLNLRLLSNKFNSMTLDNVEYFAPYIDIQNKILSLDEKKIDLFIKMINFLDGKSYDICPIIDNFLNNSKIYSNLLDSIDINNLSDEKFHNLLVVMQKDENYLEINNIDELSNENYEKLKNDYFLLIENKIDNIGINELKKNIFLKRFGMSVSQVEFLIDRYCENIVLIDNSGLPKKDIIILKTISYIYNCNDIEELKFYFIGGFVMEDFYSVVNLDSKIRKDYAKLYNDTLYKVNDKDIINENCELYNTNREVYKKIINTNYKGITPKFYLLKDDFNLQIHVLGAYSGFEVPDDFKVDWNMPKIASHGICTSYIGNNQIATARDTKGHPVYGFSDYEESALLLGGNFDLASSTANKEFVTTYGSTANKSKFLSPKDMINFTRHTHNEIVIERRNLDNTKFNFKRMPSYIVYFIDDINNVNNFDDNNSYYKETVQASVDHDIPIILVDRLYYAKKENEKCNKLTDSIFNNKEYDKINDLLVTYMNNMVGCRKYINQDNREYHNYFTTEGFNNIYNMILDNIDNNLDINDKKMLVLNLYKAVIKEKNKIIFEDKTIMNSLDYYKSLDFDKKIKDIEKMINEFDVELSKSDFSNNRLSIEFNYFITEYYYKASDDVKKMIENDIKNNVSIKEIMLNINNKDYENRNRSK